MSDIEELSTEERVAVVSKYILQAPPGEINDVVADVRQLLDDDVLFQSLLPAALKDYHQAQYTAVDVPGQTYQTIIAPPALLPVEPAKYFEPRGSQTYDFDPVKLTASNFEPLTTVPESTATFLSTIQPLLQTYISNHFSTGTGSVFPTFVPGPPPPPPAAAPAPAPEAAPVPAADEPATEAEQPKEEDPVVETALVATADEVVAVAEELKITDDDAEEKKMDDGTWNDAAEGDAMKGVEQPLSPAAEAVKEETPAASAEDSEPVPAAEEAKMDVETPVEERQPRDAVEPSPIAAVPAPVEPEVAAPPAGPNVEVIEGKYTIVTSGFRYSPQNFWTGRWRSSYAVDLTQSTLTGSIDVVVHYYEQGNVQLRSTFTPTLELPSSGAVPKDILSAISKAERAAQESINTRLEGLADKAFKSLRRALPVTRQKMEWEKVGGYKLGGAIGGGKQREEVEAQV